MTRVEFVVVGIRLLAAWFLVQGVTLLLYTSFTPLLAGDRGIGITVLVQFILICTVGILTWRFAESLALRVLPERDPGDRVTSLGKQDLEEVLFRVLGLFLGLTALSGLVYSLLAPPGLREVQNPQVTAEVARALFQFLAGACLVLGKSGLKRVVEVVRHGGDVRDDDVRDGVDVRDDDAPEETPVPKDVR